MRLGAVLLLAFVAHGAAPRVLDRTCDVASRRSSRGGVACAACAETAIPACTSGRTNYMLYSQALANAAWVKENSGGAIVSPTTTDNYALAPDCTMTATRIQIPATSGVEYSDLFQQNVAWTGVSTSHCLYVKGTLTDGTADFAHFNGGAWVNMALPFVSSGWTLVKSENNNVTGGYLKIGNNSVQNGGVARAANDILVWGVQATIGATCAGYIPTTSTAAACP